MRIWRSALPILIGAGLAASGAHAQQSQTSIGVLTCTSGAGSEGKGAAGNPALMTCGFKPTGTGSEQRYSGTMKIIGQDGQAPGGKRVWVWSVLGPEGKLAAGGLAQKYVADRRSPAGPVMVLIGESNNAISLQAETADGAAGRAMEVELKVLTTPA